MHLKDYSNYAIIFFKFFKFILDGDLFISGSHPTHNNLPVKSKLLPYFPEQQLFCHPVLEPIA